MSTDPFAAATDAIDAMAQVGEKYHALADQLRKDDKVSDEWRDKLLKDGRAELGNILRENRAVALNQLEAADQQAARRLAAPTDQATEARKARAAGRVSRVIDNGTGALDAAHMFAEAGDLDALRALRDEIPSWATAQLPDSEQPERQKFIDQTLLGLDSVMAPLLQGDEAAAVKVRLSADRERARVDAVTQHALNPTAMNQIRLAYADAPEPTPHSKRPVNTDRPSNF